MIHVSPLFNDYPEIRCMSQKEGIEARHVLWLPVRENLERAMQDRVHQDSGNASALATSTQVADILITCRRRSTTIAKDPSNGTESVQLSSQQ